MVKNVNCNTLITIKLVKWALQYLIKLILLIFLSLQRQILQQILKVQRVEHMFYKKT